jgi:hypothetical protein
MCAHLSLKRRSCLDLYLELYLGSNTGTSPVSVRLRANPPIFQDGWSRINYYEEDPPLYPREQIMICAHGVV